MEPKRFSSNIDINIRNDYGHFRMRAVALIIENDCILLATNNKEDFYYFVGGGVHVNETTDHAVVREVYEETGVEYKVDRLICIHEHFYKCDTRRFGKEDFHETGFYYLMKPRGIMDAKTQPVPEGCLIEDIHWVNINELASIDVRPKEIAKLLIDGLPKSILHIETNENSEFVNRDID